MTEQENITLAGQITPEETEPKPAYERPELVSFDPLIEAAGDCTNGTSDAIACSGGTNVTAPPKGCAGRSFAA